jgi:hypothetical protein
LDDWDELRRSLPKLLVACRQAASKYYEIFNKYPDNYPYVNDAEFSMHFSSLLLGSVGESSERLRISFTLLLVKTEKILSDCVSHQSRIGKSYLRKYKREIVPYLDSEVELHAAPNVSAIGKSTDALAAEWSKLVEHKNTLIEQFRSQPISVDKVLEIVEIKAKYDVLYERYFALNAELAKHIASRRKNFSDIVRNRFSRRSFFLSLFVALFGIVWWLFGREVEHLIGR